MWGQGQDIWIALWDAWWFERVVHDGEWPLRTQYLFYPNGVDLTYHSISWTSVAVAYPLRALFGAVAGYNVMSLFFTVFCALGMFALANYVVKARAAAWLAGALFAFDPFRMTTALHHPNLGNTAFVPLVFLGLLHAWRERRWRSAWLAALALAATLLTGAHLFIMTALSLGILFVGEAWLGRRVSDRSFWAITGHFVGACLLLVGPLVLPYVVSFRALETAIHSVPGSQSTDLLAFVKPDPQYLISAMTGAAPYRLYGEAGSVAYLGVIALPLMLVSLVRRETRRSLATWLFGLFFFLTLSLGPELIIGERGHDIGLPYRLIEDLSFIQAIRAPDRFNLIARPFFAIACAFGFVNLAELLKNRRWAALAVIPLAVLDYFPAQTPSRPGGESRFYRSLGERESKGAILEIPLSRTASKRAMFAQTVHRRPLVGGMVARTPPSAFRTIRGSALLKNFERADPHSLRCGRIDLRTELERLKRIGVEYIVVRLGEANKAQRAAYASYFPDKPRFADKLIEVHSVADLLRGRLPCDKSFKP